MAESEIPKKKTPKQAVEPEAAGAGAATAVLDAAVADAVDGAAADGAPKAAGLAAVKEPTKAEAEEAEAEAQAEDAESSELIDDPVRMYLREIAYANSNPHSDTGNGPYSILDPDLSENGRPQCSSQMSNDPLRRVVVAAGVDCAANPIGGAASGIPVERYLAMFLTEPVGDDAGSPPSFDIHGEFLGFADSSGTEESAFGGIFRDVVQLYR